MKVLFDTNVILDVLLDREPFSDDASYLLSKVEQSEIIGFVCATTITTIHYLATKTLGGKAAASHIHSLENAAKSKFNDFEDAVVHEAALHAGAKYIVTRNCIDFKKSQLPVFDPGEFINTLESLNK
jgi:predicted nucleic acid-binding protein